MKKSLRLIIVIALILTLLIPYTISYGADDELEFFEVESEEITISDVIKATLNIDNVSYDNFMFKLESDFDLSNTEIVQDEENSDEESLEDTEIIVEEDNDIIIEINKSSTSLSNVVLQIGLPSDITIGDTITLIATVINVDNEEEYETKEVVITIIEEISDSESSENSEETSETESSAENIDKSSENNNIDNNQNSEDNLLNMSSFENTELNASTEISSFSNVSLEVSEDLTSSTSDILLSSSQDTETITYNGSDNNYLSSLSVSSYELNKTFSKESTTYFITIDDDIDSLDITANAEDEEATVCIYGNSDLTSGENKILITVTAENGNTRTYRIYVTKS